MSGHTPGPWAVTSTPAGKAKVVDSSGFSVANATSAPYSQGHADARLIAAAPELLKELTHIASLLHPWIEAGNTVPGIATLNGAWAAIAKARGES